MSRSNVNGASMSAIRQRSGLSVRGLVDRLAGQGTTVGVRHISNLEREAKRASPELLNAIAKALKVPLVALLADPPPAKASA